VKIKVAFNFIHIAFEWVNDFFISLQLNAWHMSCTVHLSHIETIIHELHFTLTIIY